jgi:hypothetical protein
VYSAYYVAFEHPDGRLNDRYFTEEGAEALLRVLDNASRCAGHFGVNLNLYGRYFLALRIALGCDRRDLVYRSLDGLKRASPTRRQYWMVKCLAPLHAIAGSSITIRMLDSYSAAQRANAQPNVRGLL